MRCHQNDLLGPSQDTTLLHSARLPKSRFGVRHRQKAESVFEFHFGFRRFGPLLINVSRYRQTTTNTALDHAMRQYWEKF